MKKTKLLFISSALLASSIFAHSAQAELVGVDRASMLANTCAGCHGPNGLSNGPKTPSIAGLPEYKMIEAMNAFKSGERVSTVMQRIAKGYSEYDIKKLASYFAKQKVTSPISAK